MARRRGRRIWIRRTLLALAAIPALYLAAALIGALVPLNRGWTEAEAGTTVYLQSNGVHVDLIMPMNAHGLDWRPLLPERDFRAPPAGARWVGFGAGERRVYLDTPTWWDLTPRTIWAALVGGDRVIHVVRVTGPAGDARAIRLRPEEYRRLWASVRAEFDLDPNGRPKRIGQTVGWSDGAFYEGRGKASAIATCNQWITDRLRLAGVKVGLWTPFPASVTWRYRAADQST